MWVRADRTFGKTFESDGGLPAFSEFRVPVTSPMLAVLVSRAAILSAMKCVAEHVTGGVGIVRLAQ